MITKAITSKNGEITTNPTIDRNKSSKRLVILDVPLKSGCSRCNKGSPSTLLTFSLGPAISVTAGATIKSILVASKAHPSFLNSAAEITAD